MCLAISFERPKLTFRKRCDERYPVCTYCDLRSKTCSWPAKMHQKHNVKHEEEDSKPGVIIDAKAKAVEGAGGSRSKAPIVKMKTVESGESVSPVKVAQSSQSMVGSAGSSGSSAPNQSSSTRPARPSPPASALPSTESLQSVFTGTAKSDIAHADLHGGAGSGILGDVALDPCDVGDMEPADADIGASLQILSTKCDDFLPISLDEISPFGDFGYPFRILPGFLFTSNLDSEGTLFLEYYREKYCSFVSIAPMTLNYFLKTFFSLATRKKSILYALTAWGGFYLELKKPQPDYSRPWLYMQRAAKLMCDEIGSVLKPTTDDDFFTLFALYLIFIGIEVCTGDVDNWFQFHQRCVQLLRSSGGPAQVAQRFGYSNDIKFMLSDFKYHDLLLSDALTGGTHFSLSEFDTVLCDGDKEYGIDPLHGTIAPIYNIMGQIGNAKVEVKRLMEAIEQLEMQGQEAYEERINYYDTLERLWRDLNAQIDNCSPWKSHVRMLSRDQTQLSLHMALFELYTYICRIQLGASILCEPPSNILQQRMLLKALMLVDLLIETPLNVSLLLPLVVCGVTCWRAYDRESMRHRFQLHRDMYSLGNLKRVQEIVEEIWLANPTGDVCIDWPEFAKEHGWSLWVG